MCLKQCICLTFTCCCVFNFYCSDTQNKSSPIITGIDGTILDEEKEEDSESIFIRVADITIKQCVKQKRSPIVIYKGLLEYLSINKLYFNTIKIDNSTNHVKSFDELIKTLVQIDQISIRQSDKLTCTFDTLYYNMACEKKDWGNGNQPKCSYVDKMIELFAKWCIDGAINMSVQFEIYYNDIFDCYWITRFVDNSMSIKANWIKLFQNQINKRVRVGDANDTNRISIQHGTIDKHCKTVTGHNKLAFIKFTVKSK